MSRVSGFGLHILTVVWQPGIHPRHAAFKKLIDAGLQSLPACKGNIGARLAVYRDNGKENGKYYSGVRQGFGV